MKTFYQCDPELFLSCGKTLCQKECTLTSFKKYAKRDEFGRAIGVCVDELFELTEEGKGKPTGRWIDIQYFKNDDTYYRPKCPFCGIEPKEYSNYCPNCGADMRESEDKE